MNDSELEQRLRRLEDRDAIHQLFVDYGRYLDTGDVDAYAELFTVDGEVLLGPVGRAKGRAEIHALMTRALDGQVGAAFHIISSPRVELAGDEATAEVMWTVIRRDDDDGPTLSALGRHVDQLRRDDDGAWRIAVRRGYVDLPQRLPNEG